MKKLILFLLLPLWMVAQTSTGQEQEFDYGIKNNSTQTITTPPYLTTTGIDGTQGKIPASLIALKSDLPVSYTKVVYVNTTSPSTATIFDDVNPPAINDNLLKSDAANLYIGTDASTWVWNSSSYVTKVVPDGSNFWIYGTNIPAGSNKNNAIYRNGSILTNGDVEAREVNSTYMHTSRLEATTVHTDSVQVDTETPNTIASFDDGKQLKSLSTDTYPSLTELSYAKGVTSGIQSQINGKADLDGSGKVPLSQINDALLGSVNYKGIYNASTNSPTLPTATSSNKGWYYIISTAGTQQGFNFVNGDWIISNGTSWGKVDNNNTVTSVNGQVGAVSITASSIGAQTTLTNPITGTGATNFLPKFNGTSSQTASRFFDDGTTASIASSFTLATDLKSSTSDMILSDTNGTIFRGTRSNSWTDSVYTRFFQIGNTSDNVAFTLKSGTVMSRLLFSSAKTQFSPLSFHLAPPPVGIFEVLDGTNNVAFSVSTSGQTVINKVPTTSAGTYDLLSRNTSTGVVEKITAIPQSLVTNLTTDLTAKAPLSSPSFTDTPTAPTAPVGTNTTQIATTAFVRSNTLPLISHLEYSNTDKAIWNNGKGNIATNTVYGDLALMANTTGLKNSIYGYQALSTNSYGSENIAIGYNAGSSSYGYGSYWSNTHSTNSIFLGNDTASGENNAGHTNEIVLGNKAIGNGSNTATLGSDSVISTYLKGKVISNNVIRLKNYTVATLPAGTQGDTAFVTDATAPTYLGTLTGGGSVVCPVFHNGTAWVAH